MFHQAAFPARFRSPLTIIGKIARAVLAADAACAGGPFPILGKISRVRGTTFFCHRLFLPPLFNQAPGKSPDQESNEGPRIRFSSNVLLFRRPNSTISCVFYDLTALFDGRGRNDFSSAGWRSIKADRPVDASALENYLKSPSSGRRSWDREFPSPRRAGGMSVQVFLRIHRQIAGRTIRFLLEHRDGRQ
jgi:hypothetical protein